MYLCSQSSRILYEDNNTPSSLFFAVMGICFLDFSPKNITANVVLTMGFWELESKMDSSPLNLLSLTSDFQRGRQDAYVSTQTQTRKCTRTQEFINRWDNIIYLPAANCKWVLSARMLFCIAQTKCVRHFSKCHQMQVWRLTRNQKA